MATDADIIPQVVTDFVFDLYDSVTLSQLVEEQSRFYNSVFRDLSSKVRFFTVVADWDLGGWLVFYCYCAMNLSVFFFSTSEV